MPTSTHICFPFGLSHYTGRSHGSKFTLYRLGKPSSAGVKQFVETGRSDTLDAQTTSEGSIFDEFNIPAILSGGGRSEAKFFVDGNHTLVSLMARIVPSPDWFVGVDSFEVRFFLFFVYSLPSRFELQSANSSPLSPIQTLCSTSPLIRRTTIALRRRLMDR